MLSSSFKAYYNNTEENICVRYIHCTSLMFDTTIYVYNKQQVSNEIVHDSLKFDTAVIRHVL